MKDSRKDRSSGGGSSERKISRREAIKRMARAGAMASLAVPVLAVGRAEASNTYYGSYCSSYSSLNSYGSYAHQSVYFSSNYWVCNEYYGSYWSYG